MKKQILTIIIVFIAFNINAGNKTKDTVKTPDIFIKGEITTFEGNTHSGVLRWGKEQILLSDLFYGLQLSNKNTSLLSEDVLLEKDNYSETTVKWILGIPFKDVQVRNYKPPFICEFNQIKSIENLKAHIILTLHNNSTIKLEKGSYDLTKNISIYQNNKTTELNWKKIKQIDFIQLENNSSDFLAKTLFGTVETKNGNYTGTIEWDHQERIGNDILDGINEQGKHQIPFNDILSIEKKLDKCLVVLNNGDKLYLRSGFLELFSDFSNDLNSENRGIIITDKEIGKIDIRWSEFKKVTFHTQNKDEIILSKNIPKKLEGEITTSSGQKYRGKIIYNLYKDLNINYLIGKDINYSVYKMPLENISMISRKNTEFSIITLKNSKQILLGNSHDFSDNNDGLIVFDNNNKPKYLSWNEVKEIVFN